jgi:tRNA threonylcarbamoyladenosine biosynthesis protein TsaE
VSESISESKSLALDLVDEAASVALGENLGRLLALTPGAVAIYLEGDLGAGKTTLSRGILRALDHRGAVKSPTYTLVEIYELAGRQLYHFDLYRLGDPEELEYMGIRDYFTGDSICLIEWPARGQGVLPNADLLIELALWQQGRRAILTPQTEQGRVLLQQLSLL